MFLTFFLVLEHVDTIFLDLTKEKSGACVCDEIIRLGLGFIFRDDEGQPLDNC